MSTKVVRIYESDYKRVLSGVKHLNKIKISRNFISDCIHEIINRNDQLKKRNQYLEYCLLQKNSSYNK